MDFSLTDEQKLLQDSIGRYIADHCDVERHRRLAATDLGFDDAAWRSFAELGWLCIPFTEAQGGLGGTAADLMVTGEALGRGLVREPFLHTAVICGSLLGLGGGEQWLPSLMAGETQWAFAYAEEGAGFDLEAISSVAEPSAGGYRLTGAKSVVLNGHCADRLIVTAQVPDAAITLFVVDAGLPGITREAFTAVDGSRGAQVCFDAVEVGADAVLGDVGAGLAVIEPAVDRALVAMGGEALGAMQVLLETTVEYTRTREQFGQPIGRFQALQHRMADMYLKVEEMRSLLYNAAIQLDSGSPESAPACAALKVKLAEAGRFVSQQAVQLHGGIGMSDELIVGHLYKRLMLLSKLFGDEDYYLERFRRLVA